MTCAPTRASTRRSTASRASKRATCSPCRSGGVDGSSASSRSPTATAAVRSVTTIGAIWSAGPRNSASVSSRNRSAMPTRCASCSRARSRPCRAKRPSCCSSIPPDASSCSAPRARSSPAWWTGGTRQAVRLDDVASDPRHFTGVGRQTGLVPRTMICVPMLSKNELRGVLQIINKVDGTTFTEAELRLAQTLADHAAIAIENASLYRQAYLASITDDLTGLGNTRHFNRSLVDLVARGGPVSLAIFDLDNFKEAVDAYGHLAGSRTLAQFGRAIARLIRPGDVAARFGGDEIVIVLPDTDTAAATRIAESIRAAIEASDRLEGEDVNLSDVTASIGVATFPDHASDADS